MRLGVKKTYKLFVNGQFPRTESGHYYPVRTAKGDAVIANACKASRKDLRNAVVAARAAFSGWSGRTAMNRGQILYRIAEVTEARSAELAGELEQMGENAKSARAEIERAIDAWVYYAGWADKLAHVLGSVNAVAGPYFDFSMPEPMGVVGVVAPEQPAFSGLVALLAPAIVGGNTAVVITSEARPLAAITFGEILATSDVPAGVVNLLSGPKRELLPWLAAHMDVNALDLTGADPAQRAELVRAAAESVKRVTHSPDPEALNDESLYRIAPFMETKTVWHPALA